MSLTAFQPDAFQSQFAIAFQVGDGPDAAADHQTYRKKKIPEREFDQELLDKLKRREAIVDAIYGPVPSFEFRPLVLPNKASPANVGELAALIMRMRSEPDDDDDIEMLLLNS